MTRAGAQWWISWQPRLWHGWKLKPADVFGRLFKSLHVRLVHWTNNFGFHVLRNDFALISCRRTNRKLSQRARKANCTRCSCIPELRPRSLGMKEKAESSKLKLATPDSAPPPPPAFSVLPHDCTFFRKDMKMETVSCLRFLAHLDAVLSVTGWRGPVDLQMSQRRKRTKGDD